MSASTIPSAVPKPAIADGPTSPPRWLPVLLAGAILVAVYALSPNFRFASVRDEAPFAGDFLQEWLGGYIVRCGDYSRFYDPEYVISLQHDAQLVGFEFPARRYLPIVYPPFYYRLISPLSHLSVHAAAWIWAALMTACLVATVGMLGVYAARRLDGSSPVRPVQSRPTPHFDAATRDRLLAAMPWVLPAVVLYQPLLESLTSNQKGTVCLLIFTATFLLLSNRRPFAAGAVFGLLAFKPQLTLVIGIAMLVKHQWRFVLGGGAMGLVLAAISLTLGGDVCWQYVQFASGTAEFMGNNGYALEKSHCLYGFFSLLCGGTGRLARGATLLTATGVLYLLGRLLRGGLATRRPVLAVQFSGLVIATILLSPHFLTYDLTILLLPMFLLLVEHLRRRPSSHVVSRSLMAVIGLYYLLPGPSVQMASVTHVQITVPLLATGLALLAMLRRAEPSGEKSEPS